LVGPIVTLNHILSYAITFYHLGQTLKENDGDIIFKHESKGEVTSVVTERK
jgi:hypothetical protein